MKVLKVEVAPGYWQICKTVGEFLDACHASVGYEDKNTDLENVPPLLNFEVSEMTDKEFAALEPLEI